MKDRQISHLSDIPLLQGCFFIFEKKIFMQAFKVILHKKQKSALIVI